MSRLPNGRFAPHKPLSDDGSALFGKCVRCIYFERGYQRGKGVCVGNVQALREVKGGKGPFRGAPEGPSFVVRKLDGCSYWRPAW